MQYFERQADGTLTDPADVSERRLTEAGGAVAYAPLAGLTVMRDSVVGCPRPQYLNDDLGNRYECSEAELQGVPTAGALVPPAFFDFDGDGDMDMALVEGSMQRSRKHNGA